MNCCNAKINTATHTAGSDKKPVEFPEAEIMSAGL
jgi:hypothetical protein